jgi:hypothetical protein
MFSISLPVDRDSAAHLMHIQGCDRRHGDTFMTGYQSAGSHVVLEFEKHLPPSCLPFGVSDVTCEIGDEDEASMAVTSSAWHVH